MNSHVGRNMLGTERMVSGSSCLYATYHGCFAAGITRWLRDIHLIGVATRRGMHQYYVMHWTSIETLTDNISGRGCHLVQTDSQDHQNPLENTVSYHSPLWRCIPVPTEDRCWGLCLLDSCNILKSQAWPKMECVNELITVNCKFGLITLVVLSWSPSIV